MYKILKGQSEAVNPRKADNTIDKCTDTKGAIEAENPRADNTIDKLLMGQSEAVNPRKADNTIDKCTRY